MARAKFDASLTITLWLGPRQKSMCIESVPQDINKDCIPIVRGFEGELPWQTP